MSANMMVRWACVLALGILMSCGSRRMQQSAPSGFKADSGLSQRLGRPVPAGTTPGLVTAMTEWLGVPYKYGGNTRAGTDCSGLIHLIYPQVYGVSVPRSTQQLYQTCQPVPDTALREGDLVFFTIETKGPGHAGIYLWQGQFLHASTSRGVMISQLREPYWAKYYTGGCRPTGTKTKP
jgi:lipoprotein Spr